MNSRRKFLTHTGAVALGASLPYGLLHAAAPMTVGFIYVGPRDDFGYNQAHAQAAAALKAMPGIKVIEEENVPETNAVQKVMEAMIVQDGARLIFATSYGYFDPHVIKIAEKYPDVRIAHCGGMWTKGKHPSNAGSFFGYIEECEYLSGIIAGSMSKSKKLAFVAAKPIPQVLRNINAFTLGAQSVDPSITTRVVFTGDWSMPVKEAEAANSLMDKGCDVITCHVDSPKVIIETAEKRGVMTCGYHTNQAALAPKGYLTGAEWHWSTPDTAIVRAALDGKPMINFLRGGLKDNFVSMSPYNASVTALARTKAGGVRDQMLSGKFSIFKGPIKDNKGNLQIAGGVALGQTDVVLEGMNYLVAGVIGQV